MCVSKALHGTRPTICNMQQREVWGMVKQLHSLACLPLDPQHHKDAVTARTEPPPSETQMPTWHVQRGAGD